MSMIIALAALIIEAVVGYPDWLLRAIGHPVIWFGRLIERFDRALNRPDVALSSRRIAGAFTLLTAIAVAAFPALALQSAVLRLPFGVIAAALAASTLIAQRSLHWHVAKVATALEQHGLGEARAAVSRIVGRDPESLDASGVARAAIESLAENFSDAVVAPAFWLATGGLPAAAAYKAINTADSMIGHPSERHAAFGWAAARIDDLANLPASRLAAVLIAAAAVITPSAAPTAAWRALRRDAARHRSPNAGYPEAAMAGALGLTLGGPRVYSGIRVDDALMGDGRRDATAADIRAALTLYRRADAILIAMIALLVATVWSIN
jgi:adenosylcobinamide-phosphate synthase